MRNSTPVPEEFRFKLAWVSPLLSLSPGYPKVSRGIFMTFSSSAGKNIACRGRYSGKSEEGAPPVRLPVRVPTSTISYVGNKDWKVFSFRRLPSRRRWLIRQSERLFISLCQNAITTRIRDYRSRCGRETRG